MNREKEISVSADAYTTKVDDDFMAKNPNEDWDKKFVEFHWTDIDSAFEAGAKWADEHPSDDNIEKFFQLHNDWCIAYEEGKTTEVGFDYIKQHWNDDTTNK